MQVNNRDTYFSIDVEANGPIPGPYSMLSFGAAAIHKGELIDIYSANLDLLPGSAEDPDTMKWWSQFPEAYAATRVNTQPPEVALPDFVTWVNSISGKPVAASYPAGYDFTWLYWYMIKFVGPNRSPFSFSCLDIKTLAMARLGVGYRDATKRNFPLRWFDEKHKHTHVAVDDAIEQGFMLMRILEDGRPR